MLKGGSEADANALTTMANPLTRRAWNCLAPFTEIYVHISLHDIIKNRVAQRQNGQPPSIRLIVYDFIFALPA